jgi:hypothetical protein
MFLNSSKSIKSKIIEAAIQVDSEYRKYQLSSAYGTNPKSFTLTNEKESSCLHDKEQISGVESKARLIPAGTCHDHSVDT